ncbi:MAG: PQQ-dependent sugar dehydrogenase [Aestuariivirga sp.]
MRSHFLALLGISTALSTAAAAETQVIGTQKVEIRVETVAQGLDSPWGLAFLPDGSKLVTERPGSLRRINADGTVSEPISGTPDVVTGGQGGLLGLAIDPAFAENRRIYLCHSARGDGGSSTAVMTATLSEDFSKLKDGKTIFRQEPAVSSGRHFGCRLVFDREGALFITTGDRGSRSESAQDPATGIGKVHRIKTDGTPAGAGVEGWLTTIWSMGHRNAQGAALNPETGVLWTAEHGARGGDEVNAVEAGKNYGWPVITYGRDYSGAKIGVGTAKDGMEQPVHYWDPSIAPSGLTFYTGDTIPEWKGSVFVGALAGEKLVRLELDGRRVVAEEALFESAGARIRDVVQGPDQALYVMTDSSNGQIMRITRADPVATGTVD